MRAFYIRFFLPLSPHEIIAWGGAVDNILEIGIVSHIYQSHETESCFVRFPEEIQDLNKSVDIQILFGLCDASHVFRTPFKDMPHWPFFHLEDDPSWRGIINFIVARDIWKILADDSFDTPSARFGRSSSYVYDFKSNKRMIRKFGRWFPQLL
ncbi:MAG: hypothetical protein DLM68_13485 [Hyphomicrobiales bacterium]|nr:MAG: hypothetical protein DLM68_13485 [Hyphomicrobiales bacterium]